MSNKIATAALAAALTVSAIVPAAYADRGHGRHNGHNGSHHAYNDRGDHHRGRGHWRNGKWIALGILGAAAVGAAASEDCYWRHGRRYCY